MQKYKLEIKWATIFVIVQISWMIFEKVAGFHDIRIDQHMIVTNFFMIPAIAVFVFAFREKRVALGEADFPFKVGFKYGFLISVFVALVTPIVQVIISKVISPNYFKNVIAYAVKTGEMTLADAQSYFNLTSYMFQSTIGAIMMGTLTTLVIALIFSRLKRKS